ncbi:MAG: hypothetical protein N2039_06050 [Gemmataceae bacterium]|nr:hypothetical protein [Gemmataceae bacterium]
MDELIRVSLAAEPGESPQDFGQRLSRFWTHMLRNRPDDFERVFAESTDFESTRQGLRRHYLVERSVLPILEAELQAAGFKYDPVDFDDTYSRYEAVPPDWWQIEH